MMLAGVPTGEICGCFLPPGADADSLSMAVESWPRSSGVLRELQHLMGGKPWQELEPGERLQIAIEKHYAEMAYFLWTHNYSDLQGGDKQKADTCRQALEQRLAGTSGQTNTLDRFYKEMGQLYNLKNMPKVGNA